MHYIQVAIGIIQNANHEVLITQRPSTGAYPLFWEFPGGKVETKEISRQALTRELHEELGIEVQEAIPLIRIAHDYGHKQFSLDVWRIKNYQNIPHGKEGQATAWVAIDKLSNYDLLPANQPIVTALRLPSYYVLTPLAHETLIYQYVEKILQKQHRLIRFREAGLDKKQYIKMIPRIVEMCQQYHAQLILDNDPKLIHEFPIAGIHLNSNALFEYVERPIPENYLLGVSCHHKKDLQQAAKIHTDFAVLSPVFPTASHPNDKVLGWNKFNKLISQTHFPVYAMGGLKINSPSIWFGAQGTAGIGLFA